MWYRARKESRQSHPKFGDVDAPSVPYDKVFIHLVTSRGLVGPEMVAMVYFRQACMNLLGRMV